MYLVSACLAGINCKYSGENNYDEKVVKLVRNNKATLICPEQLGGLKTPRATAEILNGTGEDVLDGKAKVITSENEDVTQEFIKGAEETLKIAKLLNIKKAVTKSQSPSCGCQKIYDGSFSKKLVDGDGVTVALLKRNGIEVITDKQL